MDSNQSIYFEMDYSHWLHNAILTNDRKRIEDILSKNIDLNRLYYNQQSTPLRHAILQCNPDIVGLLLKHGANPNHILDDGLTAFHYAIKTYGASIRLHNLTAKLKVLLKLLRAGASIDKEIQSELAKANYSVEGIYLKEYIPYTEPKAYLQSARPDTPLPESSIEDLYT